MHKYCVYRDPLPHPALREGKISRLISMANRAMAVAQLTQLRLAIPASGNSPGEIPLDCFPRTKDMDSQFSLGVWREHTLTDICDTDCS